MAEQRRAGRGAISNFRFGFAAVEAVFKPCSFSHTFGCVSETCDAADRLRFCTVPIWAALVTTFRVQHSSTVTIVFKSPVPGSCVGRSPTGVLDHHHMKRAVLPSGQLYGQNKKAKIVAALTAA